MVTVEFDVNCFLQCVCFLQIAESESDKDRVPDEDCILAIELN